MKQLHRLRKLNATTRLSINNTHLLFHMSQAKEVVIRNTGPKMDQIYSFVSDKGCWYTIDQQQQLKAGLFYVAMPDSNSTVPNNLPPSIELRSPPPTPILTNNTTKINVNNNANRKKKVMSILGSVSNAPTLSNNVAVTTRKKKLIQQQQQQSISTSKPPLRRSKSSLVDLNIEELSDVLKKMSIFNSPDAPPMPTPPPPLPAYHQIGKGCSKYTLHFSIKYANHIQSVLQSQKKSLYKKPFFSYTFLTHYTLLPAATFAQPKTTKDIKTCYQLRGHLVDIQDWLDDQRVIHLDYILVDKYTKTTIGQAQVPLQGIAFDSQVMSDKTFNVYHHQHENEVIASVTVHIGLISGWHQHIDKEEPVYYKKKASSSTMSDEMSGRAIPTLNAKSTRLAIQSSSASTTDSLLLSSSNKKMRHHSQSSVPTLLTSSTTSSTRSSKNNPPNIHYVQQRQQVKQRPLSTSSTLLRKKNQLHHHHHHHHHSQSSHFFLNQGHE